MLTETSTNSLNLEINKINTINVNSTQINNEQIKNKNTEINNGTHSDGRWNSDEHKRFIIGCLLYGNNWKKVEGYVQTRTSTQIRSHAQKFLIKLKKKYKINELNYNNEKDTSNFIIKIDENNEESNKEEINNIIKKLDNSNQSEMEMDKVEKLLLKIFKINKKNGDIQMIKRIKTPPNSMNKKIFKCQKEMKSNQIKDKIISCLNSNEKEDLDYLFEIIKSNDEKMISMLQMICQNDDIYQQIISYEKKFEYNFIN
jgi:SHAQKYF class myb-like DNA-binding protein